MAVKTVLAPERYLQLNSKPKLFSFLSDWRESLHQWKLWTGKQTCLHQTELQDCIFQGKHWHTRTHKYMHEDTKPFRHSSWQTSAWTFANLTVKTRFYLPSAFRISVQDNLLVPVKLPAHVNSYMNIDQLLLLTGCFVNTQTHPRAEDYWAGHLL